MADKAETIEITLRIQPRVVMTRTNDPVEAVRQDDAIATLLGRYATAVARRRLSERQEAESNG